MVQVAEVYRIFCNLVGLLPCIKCRGAGADPVPVPRWSEKSWRATQDTTEAIAHLLSQQAMVKGVPRVVSGPSAVSTENQENKCILPDPGKLSSCSVLSY